jgi:hypothetical protein
MSKLPWKRADDALAADPDTESILLDDTFDSFVSERPSVTRAMNRILTGAKDALLSVGSFRSNSVRNYLLVGTASIACILLGLRLVGRIVGEPAAEQAVSSSVSASTLAAASTDARENAASSKNAGSLRSSGSAHASRRPDVGGGAAGERRSSSANADVPFTPRTASRAGTPLQAQTAAVAAAPVADAAAVDEPTVAAPDTTIYSEADRDVRPPAMLSSELPRPTFSEWTTRTNVMELIISETGAVERARLIVAPQRMPDMMLLSRAKLWKFGPAMKDGHPVRYRLVVKWEVNP